MLCVTYSRYKQENFTSNIAGMVICHRQKGQSTTKHSFILYLKTLGFLIKTAGCHALSSNSTIVLNRYKALIILEDQDKT